MEEWIELLAADGKPLPAPLAAKKFSGKFGARVEPALHRLGAKAPAAGEGLNNFCVQTFVNA